MAVLTIRNVDEPTKAALRIRAAQHGVSMEEELRRILKEALAREGAQVQLGQHLLGRFAAVADEDFLLPARQKPRTPPDWDAPA